MINPHDDDENDDVDVDDHHDDIDDDDHHDDDDDDVGDVCKRERGGDALLGEFAATALTSLS